MDLEGIILSEINQTDKDKYGMILTYMGKNGKPNSQKQRAEWRLSGAEGQEKWGDFGQSIQTSTYKSQGSNVQHGDYG